MIRLVWLAFLLIALGVVALAIASEIRLAWQSRRLTREKARMFQELERRHGLRPGFRWNSALRGYVWSPGAELWTRLLKR